jgi:8-oxo-dGTP diphosphatase
VIRAAGGVVVRDVDGVREVVVVHRPAYDDWTLPKGKAHRGESDEDCALREVEEETGLRCERGRELASSSYLDAADREKVVRYWLMRPTDGILQPTREVDEARWVPYDEAERMLSYERDRVVLRSAASA